VLRPAGVGANAFTNSIIQYFILFASMGIGYYGNRQIAYVRENRKKMAKTFWEIQIVKTIMTLASFIAFEVFMIFYTLFIVFKALGKDFDAAVMAAGMAGHGLGATPNAIANMGAVTEKYGPSTKAFLIVPLVGAFLIDLVGIPNIVWFMNYFK
jgi:ESS family glutamate:Na+ symporter